MKHFRYIQNYFSVTRFTVCLQTSEWTLSVTSACRLDIVLDFQWIFYAATMASLPLIWPVMDDLWGKCSHRRMLNFILCDSAIYTSSRKYDLLKSTALKASLSPCSLRGHQMFSSLYTNHDVTVIIQQLTCWSLRHYYPWQWVSWGCCSRDSLEFLVVFHS